MPSSISQGSTRHMIGLLRHRGRGVEVQQHSESLPRTEGRSLKASPSGVCPEPCVCVRQCCESWKSCDALLGTVCRGSLAELGTFGIFEFFH